MRPVFALWRFDRRNISRDGMQRLVLLAPILLLGVVRFGLPLATGVLADYSGPDLVPYYSVIEACFMLLPPMLLGMVSGFLLLEERDDRMIEALAVTPLTGGGYLVYRIMVGVVASFFFVFLFLLFSGLRDWSMLAAPGHFVALLFISLATALEAPILPLLLGAFARNKIEGLALSKLSGVLMVGPLLAGFIPVPWQFAGGVLPSFWLAKMNERFDAFDPFFWIYFTAALASHALLIRWLAGRFTRREN